jgi:hypothetical protein
LTIPCQFDGLGDCSVRFVSVSETDKWNYKTQSYARVINFEVTAKKEGGRYSENRIPTKNWFNNAGRLRFFKNRKYITTMELNRMISKTNIPLFFKMAQIPCQAFNDELVGKVTFKYID